MDSNNNAEKNAGSDLSYDDIFTDSFFAEINAFIDEVLPGLLDIETEVISEGDERAEMVQNETKINEGEINDEYENVESMQQNRRDLNEHSSKTHEWRTSRERSGSVDLAGRAEAPTTSAAAKADSNAAVPQTAAKMRRSALVRCAFILDEFEKELRNGRLRKIVKTTRKVKLMHCCSPLLPKLNVSFKFNTLAQSLHQNVAGLQQLPPVVESVAKMIDCNIERLMSTLKTLYIPEYLTIETSAEQHVDETDENALLSISNNVPVQTVETMEIYGIPRLNVNANVENDHQQLQPIDAPSCDWRHQQLPPPQQVSRQQQPALYESGPPQQFVADRPVKKNVPSITHHWR